MKIKQALATVLLCVLPLTACAVGGEDAPTKSTKAVSSPSSKPVAQPVTEEPTEHKRSDMAFLIAARSQMVFTGPTDSEVIELGDSICDAYGRGVTTTRIMATLMETYSYEESGSITAAATTFLCPEFSQQV